MADDDWETADLGPKPTQVRSKKGGPVLLARPLPGAPPAAAPTLLSSGAEIAPPTAQSSLSPAAAPPMSGDNGPNVMLNPASANSPHSDSPVPGDEDWFRGARTTNRQIWDTANRAGPSIVPTSIAAPPPKMQILKRPSAVGKAASNSSNSGTSTPSKSIEQREEAYRLARERIFGPSTDPSPTGNATVSVGSGIGAGGNGSGNGNGGAGPVSSTSTSASTPASNGSGLNQVGGSSAGPSPIAPSPMYPSGGGGYAPAGRRSGPSSRSTSGRGTPRTDEGAVLARAVDRLSLGPGGLQSARRGGSNAGANPGGGYVPAQYYTYGYQQQQQSYSSHSGSGYQQSSYSSQQPYQSYSSGQGQGQVQGQGQYAQYGGGQGYIANQYGQQQQQQQQQQPQGPPAQGQPGFGGQSQIGYASPTGHPSGKHSQYYAGYAYAPGAPGAPSGAERSTATPPAHGRLSQPHSQPHSHHNTPPHPGSHSHSHSSSTSHSSSHPHSAASSPAPAMRGPMAPGVLRQPRGPGNGGGFGAVGSGSGR